MSGVQKQDKILSHWMVDYQVIRCTSDTVLIMNIYNCGS